MTDIPSYVKITTRIPNGIPLTYQQMDNNLTTLQHLVPVGSIIMWGMDTLPATYLECDGSSLVIPTDPSDNQYELYQVLGTYYNHAGTPGGEFSVPDSRGGFYRHLDTVNNTDPDYQTRVVGSVQFDEFKAHTHTTEFNITSAGSQSKPWGSQASNARTITSSSAGGAETRPINIAMRYIIKALSTAPVA